MSCKTRGLAVLTGACLMILAGAALAQTKVTQTETKSFEVLAVDGNNVVVRGAEGTRELTVTEDFSLNVGGKQVSVQDLKPGMKGSATITTKTTSKPVHVTEVRNGEVIQVTGSSVVVRTDQGFRSFNQGDMTRRNVTILRDGKPVKLSDLNAGDRLTASIVTEGKPQVLTERQVQASITPDSPAKSSSTTTSTSTAAAATAEEAPAATPAAAPSDEGASSASLPETASPLPLLVLIGMASLAIGSALAWRRRRG
jgi:LPXTG-motif cell wall-anchored protein